MTSLKTLSFGKYCKMSLCIIPHVPGATQLTIYIYIYIQSYHTLRFIICAILHISADGNSLSGTIPSEIGNIKSLEVLNLCELKCASIVYI